MKPSILSLSLALAFPLSAFAAEQTEAPAPMPIVHISAKLLQSYPYRMEASSDSANLLANIPGYAVAASGGVSGLPVVNGMADDRLKVRVGALEVTSACANHMNPPMSYVDPKQVQSVELTAGVSPVSMGGDNIGGTIQINTATPRFAHAGGPLRKEGSLSLTGRSVNETVGGGASVLVASDRFSFAYDGAYSRAHSYQDGSGERIRASLYESINQSVTLAARGADDRVTLRLGTQHIPYQGFPNQFMDMTDNTARHATLEYYHQFAWGELDASLYTQHTTHEMGFFTPERSGTMPMLTNGRNRGYTLRATIPLSEQQLVRVGNEFHSATLDDYWPAVPGSMMMGPQTYVNIKDGRRDRLAWYGEVVTHHGSKWISQLGVRHEAVRTDAGAVQPYATNMMNAADAAAASAFNAQPRRRDDGNLDLTASARYQSSETLDVDVELGRKTRSPNLYERYAWGRGVMSMTMTNWFGDGNGYVGDTNLKPEAAHTLNLAFRWHGAGADAWFVKLAPYYSRVQHYIDVDTIGSFNPYRAAGVNGALLRFANHDATLYGANLSWRLPVLASSAIGQLNFIGQAALTRGHRNDGGDLYRMMPPNALLALEHKHGPWSSQVELKLVDRKDRVDARRLEPVTPAYALLNGRTAYQWSNGMLLTLGVNNILNRSYAEPLGGVYLTELAAGSGRLRPLPGQGRSIDVGASWRF